jgi:hypothetical protein
MEVRIKGLIEKRKDFTLLERCDLMFSSVIKISKYGEVGIKGLIEKRKDFTLLERCDLIFSSVIKNSK